MLRQMIIRMQKVSLIELRKDKRWDQKYQREIDLIYASMYLKQKDYYNAHSKA